MEALAKAGGLTPTAGTNIIVTSKSPVQGESVVRIIPVRDVINAGTMLA